MEKMRNIHQAQELASDIVCEVYCSFLRADEIVNMDGYVYRIACNQYARYVHRLSHAGNFTDIMELSLPYYEQGYERLEHRETLEALRREIGFLSERQRTILYLHYYDHKSVREISEKLHISPGTVKWHLSDARTALKEELVMNKYNDKLSVNPISFISMGHSGTPGEKGATNDIFDTQLKQNIAWYCYHSPHTVEEIARALNVPSVYIFDEIKILEEYGYLDRMDKSANPKFRTNMVIYDTRVDSGHSPDELYHEAAMKLCDEFFPRVFDDFEKSGDCWGLGCDGNDKNFMKYNLVMLCCYYMSVLCDYKEMDFGDKYAVERPDGGKFIALAHVTDACHMHSRPEKDTPVMYSGYNCCGYMTRTSVNSLFSLQLNCRYSGRNGDWTDNLNSDWDSLYTFLTSNCRKEVLEPEAYKRLCDMGYLFDDRIQVMSVRSDSACDYDFLRSLISAHVAMPDNLKAYSRALDERVYEKQIDFFPEHILPIIRSRSNVSLGTPHMVPRLIEEMLKRSMLKPLTEQQEKSVLTVMVYHS